MVVEFNEAGASVMSSSAAKMLKIWTLYEQKHLHIIAVWFIGVSLQAILLGNLFGKCTLW